MGGRVLVGRAGHRRLRPPPGARGTEVGNGVGEGSGHDCHDEDRLHMEEAAGEARNVSGEALAPGRVASQIIHCLWRWYYSVS